MLNFYMTPGSCATGIHILLEELELVFSANIVNLMKGEQHSPEFLAINPRGTIPALVLEDGTALTSFLSIAWWLGKTYPKRQLIPEDILAQSKMLDVMSYAVHHIHGHGFTRIFTQDNYLIGEDNREKQQTVLTEQANNIITDGFDWVATQLNGDFVCEQFSLADAALFYVEFWADKTAITLPQACAEHYHAMLSRRAVRQVLAEEGYRV